jgi:DNA (cytosine-5)-methyltransferase 1
MGALGLAPAAPVKPISLGEPALLRMGMREASELFGIVVPIGKRDRKSGAKKRRQFEIEAEIGLLVAAV